MTGPPAPTKTGLDADVLQQLARKHIAPHFTPASAWVERPIPIVTRGEGCYVFDDQDRRLLDVSAGLFCVNIGHGRADIAAAAAEQMQTLAYAPTWSAAHKPGVLAAQAIANLAPGDLDVVFFVNSGSEANESAWKFAVQYQQSQGELARNTVIARDLAYHGTTIGALALSGLSGYREPFEALLPRVLRVPNTLGCVAAPSGSVWDLECVTAIEQTIEREGADTIAALFAEPVQNSGGALVPPEGYWPALRTICDRHGILLVADEVVTGFGRTGSWFGSEGYGIVPDVITFAKGVTSGYVPLGGMIVRRSLLESLLASDRHMFLHGSTWGGHPVATAAASANIKAMHDERVVQNVKENEQHLAATLQRAQTDHQCVKTVRGTGYMWSMILTAHRDESRELTADQTAALAQDILPRSMRDAGLLIRFFERGTFTLVISPPLVADATTIVELGQGLDQMLAEVDSYLAA